MNKINIKYILTEISLVTIGILVAIAIDNWNSEKLLKKEINNYLIEVQYEIENTGIKYQINKVKSLESMTGKLIRVMKIVERNDIDSIPFLKQLIWPIGTTWPVEYSLPIIDEFINKDYLNQIDDDSLKSALKLYSIVKKNSISMGEFNREQYLNKVESYVNKNIEYLEIMDGSFWKRNEIGEHPRLKTDFKKLFNDLEFWNILTLKTETFAIELSTLKSHNRHFEAINSQLKSYLKKNNLTIKDK